MRRQSKTPIDTLIGLGDFPHLRHGRGTWTKTRDETPRRDQLVFYGKRLRALGMPDHEIVGMFLDLYWDSLTECRANGVLEKNNW